VTGVQTCALPISVVVREVIAIGDKLRNHQLRIEDLMRAEDIDDPELDRDDFDRRVLRIISRIQRADKKRSRALETVRSATSKQRQRQARAEVAALGAELTRLIEELRLNQKMRDALVAALKDAVRAIEEIEAPARAHEQACGLGRAEL